MYKNRHAGAVLLGCSSLLAAVAALGCGSSSNNNNVNNGDGTGPNNSHPIDTALAAMGKDIFRNDTFGDETFWTDTLMMNQVIQTVVDPTTALAVGLKVDMDALPPEVVTGVMNNTVDLTSPKTTVALLKLNAVVGVKATIDSSSGTDTISRVGITCALCHSTVDNAFSKGIGHRMDAYPNHDLNPGAIIALSPAVADKVNDYKSWGPGKYDPRYNQDGMNHPVEIPPAYGLHNINSVTVTGDGNNLEYWNRYVGVTQMGGHGTFKEPRTGVDVTNGTDDLISAKLPALQEYQLSIDAPAPAADSFNADAAARGKMVFEGAGKCSSCHSGDTFTDANSKLHDPSEVVSEPTYAARSATKKYRTAPLKGVWQHAPYFHDGSAATLLDVVNTYDTKKSLGLTDAQKMDLVEYLKSL